MTVDPLAWFDPPICCGCYTDRLVVVADRVSRSGVMLGERHHRQAEGETG